MLFAGSSSKERSARSSWRGRQSWSALASQLARPIGLPRHLESALPRLASSPPSPPPPLRPLAALPPRLHLVSGQARRPSPMAALIPLPAFARLVVLVRHLHHLIHRATTRPAGATCRLRPRCASSTRPSRQPRSSPPPTALVPPRQRRPAHHSMRWTRVDLATSAHRSWGRR